MRASAGCRACGRLSRSSSSSRAACRPSFLLGKLRDLVTLAVVGSTLLLSVAPVGCRHPLLRRRCWTSSGSADDLAWTVEVLAVAGRLARHTCCSSALHGSWPRPHTPDRALWQGALLGAVAFEVLKQLSTCCWPPPQRSPAFQAFGIALILLVWINYFSRIVMYAAAWAYTSTEPAGGAGQISHDPGGPLPGNAR